jgi:Tfp pilus assembly protein PilP
MRTFMKLSTGKLSTGLLFVTLTAGSALAQIPGVVQHVQDQMNAVQQQKKAAGDEALNGQSAAKAPAGKPAAATPTAAKAAATPAPAQPATQAAQKSPASPVASKPSTATAKPAAAATAAPVKTASAKTAPAKTAPATQAAVPAKHDPFVKTVARKTGSKPVQSTAAVAKSTDTKTAAAKPAKATPAESPAESKDEVTEKKKESGYITAGNRRDPFVSPVVEHLGGSGCTTGKRCLAIDQIALRGIVKSDGGMIAVVVNSLDKAYFLRENDPVFNGYVLKISGDSVVFKETVQDKLGHLSTREVVKKITTPAV